MSEFSKPNRIQNPQADAARQMVTNHLSGRSRRANVPNTLSPNSTRTGPNSSAGGNKVDQTNTTQIQGTTSLARSTHSLSAHPRPPVYPDVQVPAKDHHGECRNPQCARCGTVIIPLPKAVFPFHEKPLISVKNWSIYTCKNPILLLDELDRLNEERFDFPLPEMIFGNNHVRLVDDSTGCIIEFNTLDALDSLANEADFKVRYHKEWLSTRPKAASDSDQLLDLDSVKPYDWTYSTNYKGSLSQGTRFEETESAIPLEKLLRPDPILFYDESVLFEDELGDNGIAMLSTKIRVMHSCLLLLCRLFLRVDEVALRIRDTRIYVDFDTNEVFREYKTQEATYEELLQKVTGRDPKKLLRDSNWVSQNMKVLSSSVEKLVQRGESQ